MRDRAIWNVLLDEVGVDGDRGSGSFACGSDHLCPWVAGVPGHPGTGDARLASGIDAVRNRPHRRRSRATRSDRLCAGAVMGRMKTAARGMTRPSTPTRPRASDRRRQRMSGDGLLRSPRCLGRRVLRALSLVSGVRVGEEDDVVRPLPEQLRVVDGAGIGSEDADRLVAHLPAVAVRAVQKVAAPALRGPGMSGSSSRSRWQQEPRAETGHRQQEKLEARLN